MTRLALTASAAAILLCGVSTPASAAIFISFDGTTSVFSQAADDAFEFTAACGADGAGCGGFEVLTVEGNAPLLRPGLLHSDNVDVNESGTGAASIDIWVTRTGLSGDDLTGRFFSSFTSNNLGDGITVGLATYVSASNALFTGTELADFFHAAPGAASQNTYTNFAVGDGLYSVTQRYTITAAAAASDRSASPSITLATTAVPEPGAWALMILGFGGAGAMIRRRRTQFSLA